MRETWLDVFLAIFSFAKELNFTQFGYKFENVTSHRIARGKITR